MVPVAICVVESYVHSRMVEEWRSPATSILALVADVYALRLARVRGLAQGIQFDWHQPSCRILPVEGAQLHEYRRILGKQQVG